MASLKNTGKFRAPKPTPRNDQNQEGNTGETSGGRLSEVNENIRIDHLYGFHRVTDIKERTGFLINMHATEIIEDDKRLLSGVDYYFLESDCSRFKVSYPYSPYFYVLCKKDSYEEVATGLNKKYPELIQKIETLYKEDLDLPNHLVGLKQKYLKLYFLNTVDLNKVKKDLAKAVRVNKEREKTQSFYTDMLSTVLNPEYNAVDHKKQTIDFTDNILDIREHDVPHHVRVSIDMEIFCGKWYSVRTRGHEVPIITRRDDIIEPVEPIVLAYDIETTKLPLKFPDANTDQIMMISYMIDGQGYLITNREIISSDIEDFEYTPKPEFEGFFKVFNELNEKALIKRFFDHINDIRPHVFVTYNGDFFDWPFVETRAAFHKMDMKERIGFSVNRDKVYACRPAMHMDCLSWVRRDSYLPVGSQNLKAVTKAKLRYNPVELDPEDMCKLASEQPEVLANYSVSDAVATYYLYHKYVHPFIFALCTIIPMEPDEVLRKGSGTLCESLLMVQAFQANIIFPNKQEIELNKLTKDGHLLDQETYVGGHVEALESGVFRADIPCRFKIVPSAIDELLNGVESALVHAIQEEEKVPMEMVQNFDEVVEEIKGKLTTLKNQPLRVENPVIYHLDVGAMYPNIILTNRLQPSAMVNETDCAACDYNKPGALCQRNMQWMWRGEYLAASLSEYQRMLQQLENEKFPPQFPGGTRRAYHELSKQEQATYAKKRLTEYCKKAYKKVKVTRMEERTQTVCQRENSFYVDTVRAFRDRRYEYKGLTKVAKQQVAAALVKGDAAEIKSAKNREVLYDSLQLAHKCILNSFYGYVMRKGSRWFSMEMGGIVCYTGAHIIMKAREIIEQVGRPLELDTDGIWCLLPASFPDNVVIHTTHQKKSKLVISYPNAVLNFMVKDQFTNNVYHELVDPGNLTYKIRNENSIFFEVDGPYLAMVLPAAKEEGKKLKKRYAVFNFDGTLAELKGFEVKRRGELQLIKIFQTSVFESFLKGNTLEECYASVARDADYWLDILYSKCENIPDSELFELISENKSMSRKLEDYGEQKSTSISTAKRLAEFLGDQMVKDAGLACKYIIANKPQGAPVTERAIPLAIFQSEPAIKRYYLRKWLKDPSLESDDIRHILDWSYYIERLANAIQKIITIPAAMQGLANPVPRVKHPDWLHKRVVEKGATHKQKKITDMFSVAPKCTESNNENLESTDPGDIEDLAAGPSFKKPLPIVHQRKRKHSDEDKEENSGKNWKDVLGSPPPMGTTKEERLQWLKFHKEKWAYQAKQRAEYRAKKKSKSSTHDEDYSAGIVRNVRTNTSTLSGFLRQAQRKLFTSPWQIIQISATKEPGMHRLWVLVDDNFHQLRLIIPRIFYVNTRIPKSEPESNKKVSWRKSSKFLPRSRPVYNLYRYSVPEVLYQMHSQELLEDLSKPEIEGIYETQMSLEFRAIVQLGCICTVDSKAARSMPDGADTFTLDQLEFKSIGIQPYLENMDKINFIFLYHHWSSNHQRALWGLFLNASRSAHIFALDTVESNQMPNMNSLYVQERELAVSMEGEDKIKHLPQSVYFVVKAETSFERICRTMQAALTVYKNEKYGPTVVLVQTALDKSTLTTRMPLLNDFPLINTHVQDMDNLYNTLEWQKVGAKIMIRHYLKTQQIVDLMAEQCRFFHSPIGNIPEDPTLFGADLFYARHLQKHNFVLWCSSTEKPDLGGSENDDNRLLTDFEESTHCAANNPSTYSSVSIELEIENLAVNTLLQYHHIHDADGTSNFVAFHNQQLTTVQDMATGELIAPVIPSYDETALCNPAFRALRTMVNTWLLDVSVYKNVFADHQVIHFYRWLRSPNALLYDPALRRTLHTYMKKLFIQLLAEFKILGSIIIFANFNKIILCTKKRSVADALGYIEFVVQTIKNKEIFHGIEISFEQAWQYLIWLDIHNHGGIKGKLPKTMQQNNDKGNVNTNEDTEDREEEGEEREEREEENEEEEEDEASEVVMYWNLKECLPEDASCRSSFNAIITGYITAIYRYISENEQLNATINPRRRRSISLSQSLSGQLGLGSLENTAEFVKNLISGDLSQKIFQIVQKIHKTVPEITLTAEEYPNLDFDGKDSKRINPALELIKAVTKVLSLDKEVENEVYNLQNNMLRLIGVGSFSDVAEWKDPCISLVMPEVICKACNHTRDIDLCKDTHYELENDTYVWKCPLCNMSYDNEEIEFLLIDVLNRKCMAYVLQDLQCRKCKEIKRENMNELCSCSGEFKTLIPRHDIMKFAKICRSVAKKCNMETLLEMAENTEFC